MLFGTYVHMYVLVLVILPVPRLKIIENSSVKESLVYLNEKHFLNSHSQTILTIYTLSHVIQCFIAFSGMIALILALVCGNSNHHMDVK